MDGARIHEVSPENARFPGATRYSMVTGLMASPSHKAWNSFRREGPYWNYLVRFIRSRNIFRGREDRVEEAVMNACEKIAKFMETRRYECREAGKGYFRKFIKVVAWSAAMDLYREIRRQEQIAAEGPRADGASELDETYHDMVKANERHEKMLAKERPAGGMGAEIAEMFDYRTKMSEADLAWVRQLQTHVLFIALGYVLANERVSAEKRELLRLRYGLGMAVKEIMALPQFAAKDRRAFDTQMCRAKDELRKEVKAWWALVAPDKNDFADEAVLRFWREFGRKEGRARTARALQDKAVRIAGRIR